MAPVNVKKVPTICFPPVFVQYFNEKLEKHEFYQLVSEDDEIKSCIAILLDQNSSKQLEILKKVFRSGDSVSVSPLRGLLIELLINILFSCHQEHAIKSAINGAIRHLPETDQHTMSFLVEEKLESNQILDNVDGIELVGSLALCSIGQLVISNVYETILNHIKIRLKFFASELKQSKSPTQTAKTHNDLHSAVRTLLSVIKLKQFVKMELNTVLLDEIVSILNLDGIPLEVQGNCSKILTIITSTRENGISNLIQMLSEQAASSFRIQLNICHGIMSSLDKEVLLSCFHSGGTLLGSILLPIIMKPQEDGFSSTAVAVLTGRCLEQWMVKCLDCFKHECSTDRLLNEWNGVWRQLLEVVLNHLEHQIDTVRYSAKNAFQFYLQIHLFLHDNTRGIMETVLNMALFKKSKYMALTCLAKCAELAPVLLEMEPNLGQELLQVAKDPSLFNQAMEVYNSLVLDSMKNDASWAEKWLYPLLDAIGAHHRQGHNFESWLSEILKSKPELIRHLEKWFDVDSRSCHRLTVYISAVQVCRKLGLLSAPKLVVQDVVDPSLWNNTVKMSVMRQALTHDDPKLRLTALAAIIEGPKTTQLFSPLELGWIRQFVTDDLGNPNAAFRQQLCSSMKKLLLKLRDGGVPLIGRNEHVKTVESYRLFLKWLVDNCLSELGPNSNFTRRFLSLHFLRLVQDIFGFNADPDASSALNSGQPLTPGALSSLIDCLFDSFDVNKDMALELLKAPPLLRLMNEDLEWIELYWKSSCALSQSIRSADTIAASFLLRVLVSLEHLDQVVRVENRSTWTFQTRNTFNVVRKLCELLKMQLERAKENPNLMGVDAPIYGVLLSIRLLLLNQQHRTEEMNDPSWTGLLDDLVDLCFESSAIASPVVTSESPEGFLPEIDEMNLIAGSQPGEASVCAQALLVCTWRTIKEVSLFFGQLSSWMITTGAPLISNEIILKMGEHLRQLLLETKHRGAFEQVYCGFSQLCYALWRCPNGDLYHLPATWLQDIIKDLKRNQSATKLCATRRSAGLPFMFQAILSPEVELGHGQLFAQSMEVLLDVAGSGPWPESRIHSLNIMRTLYRESRLSQVIGPYVARGLILAIAGFEAQDWPERNSSTLLFSALMTRIFGVARSKTELHKRNSLTGRAFFQMYPQLYPFLLQRLRGAVDDLVHGHHLHPSLFPILVLIGRLHPPACEAADNTFQLETFVPLIRMCGSSSVLKTRQLAALALTPLLTASSFVTVLQQLFDDVTQATPHNKLHGALLQILHFVKEMPTRCETSHTVHQILKVKVPDLLWLLTNRSYVIRYEYVSIIELLSTKNLLEPNFQTSILRSCLQELSCEQRKSTEPFYPLYCEKLAEIAVSFDLDSSEITRLLHHSLGEVRTTILQQLEQSAVPIPAIGHQLFGISNDAKNSTACRSLAVSLLASQLIDHPWGDGMDKLSWTMQLCRTSSSEELRCAALVATGRVVALSTSTPELILEWSRLIVEECESGSVHLRSAVIQSMDHSVLTPTDTSIICGQILSNCWMCLLRCLMDDDESVRCRASALVAEVIQDSRATHPAVALDQALKFFVEDVGRVYPVQVVVTLFKLVRNDPREPPEEDSQSFEKGDSDTFHDPVFHSILFSGFMKRSVERNPMTANEVTDLLRILNIPEDFTQTVQSSFDVSNTELIAKQRRSVNQFCVDLLRIYLVAGSLETLDERFSVIRQQIRDLVHVLPKYCIGHILHRIIFDNPE